MAIARAKGALDDLQKKVADYDWQFKVSETASAFLNETIQQAYAALDSLDELSKKATVLKDKAAEVPTEVLLTTLAAASIALAACVSALALALGAHYDEQYKLSSTVAGVVEGPQQRCLTALADVSDLAASVAAGANAQLHSVHNDCQSRAACVTRSSAKCICSTAATLNERFNIEGMAISAGTTVVGKTRTIDEHYNVKEILTSLAAKKCERAQEFDLRVTGGKVTPAVLCAFEKGLLLASNGLTYMRAEYELAKHQQAEAREPGRAVALEAC